MTRRIGIDLAVRASHRAAIYEDGRPRGRPFNVEASRAGFDELMQRAAEEAQGAVEVVMEPTGPVWLTVAADFARRGCRVFVPNGRKAHGAREFVSPQVKSDSRDAAALALLPHLHPEGVHEWRPPTATVTALRQCLGSRAGYVKEASRLKTRIRARLDEANPVLANTPGWEPFTAVGTALLTRWLDPFRVRARGEAAFRRFWAQHAHGTASESECGALWSACIGTCELLEPLMTAGLLPFDYTILQALMASDYKCLRALEERIADLDRDIERLYVEVDPTRLLQAQVPGVAATIAPALEAYIGDIRRFPNIKSFVAAFGIVPGARQSGGKPGAHGLRITKAGPALLRKYLYLAAETARRCDPELAARYQGALDKGKHHRSAVVIVAHKLLRKIYALLKARSRAHGGQQPSGAPRYEYRAAHSGEPLDKPVARATVQQDFPSKARQATSRAKSNTSMSAASTTRERKVAAEAEQVAHSGSLEGATRQTIGTPPARSLPQPSTRRKAVGTSGENLLTVGDVLKHMTSSGGLDRT